MYCLLARTSGWMSVFLASLICAFSLAAWGADTTPPPGDSRRPISLKDAALEALERNLDITISRNTKDTRVTDILFEQAKFDPTVSLNGQYSRLVSPLNRPILGFSDSNVTTTPSGEPTKFDLKHQYHHGRYDAKSSDGRQL